jgi:hypothetical protein
MTVPMFPVTDLLDVDGWGLDALVPDALDGVLISSPTVANAAMSTMGIDVSVTDPIVLRLPGIDVLALVVGSTAAPSQLTLGLTPFSVAVGVPLLLRLNTDILCPVDANDRPDRSQPTFDVDLGTITLEITADADVNFDIDNVTLPRCMIGMSGVIIEIGKLKWLSPSTPASELPANTPSRFTGLYLDDVKVTISQLPAAANALRLDNGFIGTGGFSGKVSAPDLNLNWDPAARTFTETVHGDLFGFQGGLSAVALEFRQNAIVGCAITGDLLLPWLDRVIGLELGLGGDGTVTALACLPHSPGADGVTASAEHLFAIEVADILDLGVDSVGFSRAADDTGRVEITGAMTLTVPGLNVDVGVNALRIDSAGNVDIDGGYLDVPTGVSAPFHGFPLEISKVGFGSDTDDGGRRWVALSGALNLAAGLPVGGSVDGLKISWRAHGAAELRVSLAGVAINLDIPGVVTFDGSVAFVDDGINRGFAGGGTLTLPAIGVRIDVGVAIGRTGDGETYFYFHLGVDLPVGIPLMQTGLAFYGFEGLVARNMAPDRRNGEGWYWGWYVRDVHGATHHTKWAVRAGAFAAGLGTTIGTVPDSGFTANAKILLVLVLPGPVLLLEGKGSLLKPRSAEEGSFEALLALDVPAELVQIGLAATYKVPRLVTLRGGADLGFSWARPPLPHFWHVYLGEDEPPERRWHGDLLGLFTAEQYLMIEPSGPRLGAEVIFDEDWGFGPVDVSVYAEISGDGEVSLNPQHLHGHMRLKGELTVAAYGAKLRIGAHADFDVDGPKPWEVVFDLYAHIEIDAFLFDFSWSKRIHLEWKDTEPPRPVEPIVARVARRHLVVDDGGDLAGVVVAPDHRYVVEFARPVRDLPAIAAGASITKDADQIGPARFSYQLGHVALHRRRYGAWTVVAASGFVDVRDGHVRVPGLTLEGAAGSRLNLVGGATFDVTGAAAGEITLAVGGDGVTAGRTPYRLAGCGNSASRPIRQSIYQVLRIVEPAQIGVLPHPARGTPPRRRCADRGRGTIGCRPRRRNARRRPGHRPRHPRRRHPDRRWRLLSDRREHHDHRLHPHRSDDTDHPARRPGEGDRPGRPATRRRLDAHVTER